MSTQKIAGGTVHRLPADLRSAIESNEHDVLSWVLQALARLELVGSAGVEDALDDAKHADRLANSQSARARPPSSHGLLLHAWVEQFGGEFA